MTNTCNLLCVPNINVTDIMCSSSYYYYDYNLVMAMSSLVFVAAVLKIAE